MHRLSLGDVPLPVTGPVLRGSAGTLSPSRQRSWDLPFAALILSARLPDVSVSSDPPAVSRALRLDPFHRVPASNCLSARRAILLNERITHYQNWPVAYDPSRLLGLRPNRQSAARRSSLAAAFALLPWALPLSGFGAPAGAITRARTPHDSSAPGNPLPAPIRSWALGPPQGPLKRACPSAFL